MLPVVVMYAARSDEVCCLARYKMSKDMCDGMSWLNEGAPWKDGVCGAVRKCVGISDGAFRRRSSPRCSRQQPGE